MSGRFLSYLKSERERLDRALSSAPSGRTDEGPDPETLERLRSIVDLQLASWARELGEGPIST